MPNPTRSAEQESLLMPAEVMARLRVSRQTLARYVAAGQLPAIVLPSGHRRYREADVARLEVPA